MNANSQTGLREEINMESVKVSSSEKAFIIKEINQLAYVHLSEVLHLMIACYHGPLNFA